jgi:hypothetical protein
LTQGLVPDYLLYAICALAIRHFPGQATLSQPPLASKHFLRQARTLLINDNTPSPDEPSRLNVARRSEVAQALCLLLWLDEDGPQDKVIYRELALRVVNDLIPELDVSSDEARSTRASIELECLRRVFWLVFAWDHYRILFPLDESYKPSLRPLYPQGIFPTATTLPLHRYTEVDMRIPLPSDEASFDMGIPNDIELLQPVSAITLTPYVILHRYRESINENLNWVTSSAPWPIIYASLK